MMEEFCTPGTRESKSYASLGFDEVFDIVESSAIDTDEAEELLPATSDAARIARTLLAAHRTLLDLNEANRALFEEVVSTLEQERAD